MNFRKKRVLLLAFVGLLLLFLILDITVREEAFLEEFGEQFLHEERTESYNLGKTEVTTTVEQQLEYPGQEIKTVQLTSMLGKVSVKRSPDAVVRVKYAVTVSAKEQAAAQRKAEAVSVVEEGGEAGQLTLEGKVDGRALDYDDTSIDYVLFLPDGVKLQLDNRDTAVHIQGIQGDVHAASQNGLLEMIDVRGTLTVDASRTSLYLKEIIGDVDVVNHYGGMIMEDVEGNAAIKNVAGLIQVHGVRGDIETNTTRGTVLLQETTGTVTVNGNEANVQLNGIRGHSRVKLVHGDLKLVLPEGSAGYRLDTAVWGGNIRTHLPAPIESRQAAEYERYMSSVIGEGTWQVDAKVTFGDITIQYREQEAGNHE